MNKAIITGANGFVGKALCKELSDRGVKVYAVIREGDENMEFLSHIPNVTIVGLSMENYNELPEKISEKDVDVLYHFAWIGTAGGLRGDLDAQLSNIKYACDIIKICLRLGCKRVVFPASIMEYEIQKVMNTEKKPGINSLYSTAKITADYMMRAIAENEEVEYIRALVSNIYGPFEYSPRLINTSLRKLINGEHCSFTEGNQLYDFIYITDAAKVFAEIGEKGKDGTTYYIGSTNPRPLREYLLEMSEVANSNIKIGLGEIPFDGVSLTYEEFDRFAVQRDTGFVPEIDFKEGIKRTIEWMKEENNGWISI